MISTYNLRGNADTIQDILLLQRIRTEDKWKLNMCLLDVVKEDLKKRIEKESIKINNIKDVIQNYQDRVNSQAL